MSQLTKEVIQHLYMRKPMEYGHNILYHNTNATMSDREKIMVKSESDSSPITITHVIKL